MAAPFQETILYGSLVADGAEVLLLRLWRRECRSARGCRVDVLEPAFGSAAAVAVGVESARLVGVVGAVLLGLTVEELALGSLIAASWCIAARSSPSTVTSPCARLSLLTNTGISLWAWMSQGVPSCS